MKVTFYGHATFMIETGGKSLMFDPFISPNPKAADIDVSSLKPDFMLISHGHEDHVADAVQIAQQSDCTVVSNFEIVSWFGGKGVEKGHPMNIGGNWKFDFGRVKSVVAIHSSVMPDGAYGGNPGGFVVESEGKTFYYAGDTALTYDMKLIAEEFDLDFAILPIGDNFTMGIEDAVKAAQFVGVKQVIGMHFDTFPYIEIDHAAAKSAFEAAGISLTLLNIGESADF